MSGAGDGCTDLQLRNMLLSLEGNEVTYFVFQFSTQMQRMYRESNQSLDV
jgi:hypothetical protein